MHSVTVLERPEISVAVVPHKGNYAKIGGCFEKLMEYAMDSKAPDWSQGIMGLYYDNPETTPERDLNSAAAIALLDGHEIAGLETRQLAGGRYACLEYKGPYESLPAVWEWFDENVLQSDEFTLREEPALEIYLNSPEDTDPEDLITILAVAVA